MDSLEEFFWLLRFPGPYRYNCGAAVEGFTQPERWDEAWNAIRPFFGVLRASIRKQPGSRPAFVRTDLFTPAAVHVWEPGLDLDSIMAADLNDSSEDWDAVLVRLTVYWSPERSMVLLGAHHSGSDGITCLSVLESLLASVAGCPRPETRDWWPAPSALLRRDTPREYERTLPAGTDPASHFSVPRAPTLQVRSLALSIAETLEMTESAKRNRTTVHSALLAAFATALGAQKPGVSAIHCSTPMDLRSITGTGSAQGALLSIYSAPLLTGGAPFWDRARAAAAALLSGRTLAAAQQRTEAMNALLADEMTFQLMQDKLASGLFGKDLTLTNLGREPMATLYGGLRVVALAGAVHSGSHDAQTISAVTLGGSLRFTQISRQPVPGLLEKARDMLVRTFF